MQSGDAKITNHTIIGEEANIKFHAYSYFSRERQKKVLSHPPTHTLSLSLTHTHTHTHTLSLSLSHTHTHTLSLSLSLQLTGSVTDGSGKTHYILKGYWDDSIHISKVLEGEGKNAVLSEPELAWTNIPPEYVECVNIHDWVIPYLVPLQARS